MPPATPIACRLDAEHRTTRLAAARKLGEHALVGLEVSERRALLRFHGEHEGVDALVAAERACCAFFEFTTTRSGEQTELEIRTPEGGEPILRGLVAGIVAGWEGGLT
ncbi:MAG: hypothetical protein ACRDNP_10750 [Gaiellaceae bacterium]